MVFLILDLAFAQSSGKATMMMSTFDLNGTKVLAVSFENEKKWHTYWKNPGDAGLAPKFKFKVDGKEFPLKEYPWPTPKRFIEQGDMWAYGYDHQYHFFFKLPNKLQARKLSLHATWLICKDICIPGEAHQTILLDQNVNTPSNKLSSHHQIRTSFNQIPHYENPKDLSLFLTKGQKKNQLALHFILEDFDPKLMRDQSNILTPYLQTPLDYKHEEIYFDKATNTLFGRIYIDWDGMYEDPAWKLPEDGIFKNPINAKYLFNYPKTQNSKIFTHKLEQFTLKGDKELSKKFQHLIKLEDKKKALIEKKDSKKEFSLLTLLFFAFLGGLILNLMPCVLPVISLKLFGLIVHSDEKKSQILKHNMVYTLGVVTSFLSLASIVAILKASGEQIGWGFQLQSPIFVYIMILVIFVLALNMFGLFEFVTPGGKTFGNAKVKSGFFADFINGVLATILSTPCSAPFLGTALAFAFTTSIINSYLIFTAVGLGLSAPFLVTGLFPKLVRFLPKPGLWMEKLKYLLGLSLLLTQVWLTDVLFGISDFSSSGLYFLTSLCLIFFGIFFIRRFKAHFAVNIFVVLLVLAFTYKTTNVIAHHLIQQSKTVSAKNTIWTPWSEKAMQAAQGKFVFMNFTAKWCLTCKVNKRLVLDTKRFKSLAAKKNMVLLEADWTTRDDHITEFLRQYNIVGVPAYFIQTPNGHIISLGETISINEVKKHVD